MAFECPHCGLKNNEIQSGGTIAEKGVKFTCKIENKQDLNRQIIKNETASIKFVELDFEIPANTQKGLLNTVEGFLMKAKEDLAENQEERRKADEKVWIKVDEIITKIQDYIDGKEHFTVIVDDPAGNSYIENLCAPKADPQMTILRYRRTPEQCESIGLDPQKEAEEQEELLNGDNMKEEVFSFPSLCSNCGAHCDTKMKLIDIPYFKEVIIMSTVCDGCGYKSNEVKSGGAIAPKGRRIALKVTDIEDLSRDILKSESCGLKVPEIDLELDSGTLGGKFTTVEGLLQNVYDELESKSPFSHGDSMEDDRRTRLEDFLSRLKKVVRFEIPFTLILDDPLGNSYLQNLYAPDPDPNMTMEEYERTFEQDEFLGLNDIQTENYGHDDSVSVEKKIHVFRTVKALRTFKQEHGRNTLVGFVPTMGSLHHGHLDLCRVAAKNSDMVIASIFVNPAQFAPNEDFADYPRQIEQDVAQLESLGCVDAVFAPTAEEMYPTGITLDVANQSGTFVQVLGISHQLEGKIRPHFFRGVATVVTKLFNAVQPDIAVFGQKDIQQCVVIKRMVQDLLMPVKIIVAPTKREADGLAMSSRNRYLSTDQRSIAPILYKALSAAHDEYLINGRRSRMDLVKAFDCILDDAKDKNLLSLDYLSIAHPKTLDELEMVHDETGAIISATIRVGKTRLLDNILLNVEI